MKKISIIFLVLLSTSIVFAQRKEKISGSKITTTKNKNIKNFSTIEVEDNIQVSLERGEYPEIKIEADDNLIDVIEIEVIDNVLHLTTSKKIVKQKSLKVKVTYTSEFNTIITKNEAVVTAIQEILNDNFTVKTYDNSKIFMNANSKNFTLEADGNSKTELNLKSEKIKIALTKGSDLKSLITTNDLIIDLYQKAKAKIEGEANNGLFRLENNSVLEANKLNINAIVLIAEGQSKNSINPKNEIVIHASEKSETELYGDAKIEIKEFTDKAKLSKNTL